MSGSKRAQANASAQILITKFIESGKRRFESDTISNMINSSSRRFSFTPLRAGRLLTQRDDVRRNKNGTWEVVNETG